MVTPSFVARRPIDIDFEGQHIALKPGDSLPFKDDCELIRFVNAVKAQAGGTVTDHTPGGLENVQCSGAGGGGPVTIDAPDTPPVNADPSPPSSEADAAPTDGEDDAETLDAPAPDNAGDIQASPDDSGIPDDRSPAQQMRDPQAPKPDYDIADELAGQGLGPDEIEDELEAARQNTPPSGEPHPDFSKDLRVPMDTTADPVLIFSGQYQLAVTDVEIASRGFPLRFQRLYRSGTTSFGPFGFNWDHNYNVYLRLLTEGRIAAWTGALTEDVYTPAGTGFEPPFSVFRRLEFLVADATGPDRWVISEREGRRLVFAVPSDWPYPDRVPLVSIEDRFGNVHVLTYDELGRLHQVADDAGRFLLLQYGDNGLLESIGDHGGRVWHYRYDEGIEHLIGVVTPSTPDFADGICTGYEYSRFHPHPALTHNLVRVIDNDGQTIVENYYGDDPATDDFNRVIVQVFGGSESEFTTTQLQFVPRGPDALNIPAWRVEVVDPGFYYVYTFNWRGDLLDKRFRLGVDGTFRRVASTYRYDEHGNLTERYDADGRGMVYEYDSGNSDPRARGNLLRVEQRASPLAPASSRELLRATYEPVFQQLKSVRDAAGSVTEFVYDYERQPMPQPRGALVELRHPTRTLPDGTQRQAIESFEYNGRGQLNRHSKNGCVHTFEYETAGLRAGYLRKRTSVKNGVTVSEAMERDTVGNLIARIDGVGNRQEYDINALGLLVQTRLPDGAIWAFEYDASNHVSVVHEPRGDYDDPVLASSPIRHELTYDVLGHSTLEVLGANTENPRRTTWKRDPSGEAVEIGYPDGRVVRRTLDERGLTVREDLFDTAGELVVSKKFGYSKVGQLARAAVGNDAVVLSYDGFGALRTVTAADGLSITYQRDARGLVTQVDSIGRLGGAGSAVGLLSRKRFDLDETGAVRRSIDVVFTDPNGPYTDLVTRLFNDDSGAPERIESPTGLVTTRTYGPYDMIASELDSLGNEVALSYDSAGRQTNLRMVSASSVGSAVIGTHITSYDAVGRVASETDPLGNTVRYGYDLRGMLRRLTNPLGQILEQDCNAHGEIAAQRISGIETQWTFDAAGRTNTFIDPTGQVLRFSFDARDKVSEVLRPDGARQTYRYEQNGALREFVDYDGTVLEYTNDSNGLPLNITTTPAAGVAATPDLQLEYDGARRIARASYGGVSHLFQYDSLGRRLSEEGPDLVRMSYDAAGLTRRLTYPDGRRDRHEHDSRGRLVRVVLEANAPARLGSLNDGAMVAEFGWFGADRLERVRTAGTEAVLRYDVAERLIEQSVTGAAGAVVHRQDWFLDALGQRRGEALRAGANMAREHQFDELTRLTHARVGLALNALPGSAVGLTQAQIDSAIGALAGAAGSGDIAWSYFLNDTPEQRIERNGTGQVVSTRVFTTNTLHQVASVDGAAITYSSSGNLSERGTRAYRYDAYRRLVAVEEGGVTVATIQYDGLGRMHQLSTPSGTQRLVCWEDELLQVSGVNAMQLTPGPLLDRAVSASVGSSTFGLITDGIGSLVAACDQAGAVVERYNYEFFGAPTILAPDGTSVRSNSSVGLVPRFQGRPWLAGTGLYDFRNRCYDPVLQVFLQPDPFALSGSWGPYGFCRFNPVDYVDPYGLFWHIVIGAAVGAAIGGISTAIHGGDWRDILVATGAGAVGGAFTAAGMPMLGAAAAGGMMGAWSGGRIGYQMGGTQGALLGALGGGVLGAGLGAATGAIGSRVGNAVSTRLYGTLFNRALAAGLSGQARVAVARYGSLAAGGFTGGAAAGVFGNTSSTVAVDLVTGRPITADQLRSAVVHGVAIDGPLAAVGASGERLLLVSGFRGRLANKLGMEGETLVGRDIGIDPAQGTERIIVNGRERRPDFPTRDTLRQLNGVVEVKNKTSLSTSDVRQISDFAQFAQSNQGDVILHHRPGLDLTPVQGIGNLRAIPIQQQPMVVSDPIPFSDRPTSDKGRK